MLQTWLVLWTVCTDFCLEKRQEHSCFRTNMVKDHWTTHESWQEAEKTYKHLLLDRNVLMANICDPVKSTDFISPTKRKARVKT